MTTSGPHEINTQKPSAARMYDWYLGGDHNYAVDRTFGRKVMQSCPPAPVAARQNRDCLGRFVRFLAKERGIRQFIDVGSGVPTAENVHQVAHAVDPTARVVYVDNDNEAIVSSRRMLTDEPNAIAIHGDIKDVGLVLDNKETRRLIDFSEPVGLIMMAVLHFVHDKDRPAELVGRYLDVLPSGSFFAASHVTAQDLDTITRGQFEALERDYGDTNNPAVLRDKAEFERFFDTLELVEPGITYAVDWHNPDGKIPDNPHQRKYWVATRPSLWAAVGRKP